jgi:hypothetical protein
LGGRDDKRVEVVFELGAIFCPIGDIVFGDAVIAEAEKHVGVDEARLVQLQQQVGSRIAHHQLSGALILSE